MHELKFLKTSMQVICCFVISNRVPNKRKHICRCHPTFLRLGCDKMLVIRDDLHGVVKDNVYNSEKFQVCNHSKIFETFSF